jgi:hypothetical protein
VRQREGRVQCQRTLVELLRDLPVLLHDSGEADGFLYYVMPYVEGETLRIG